MQNRIKVIISDLDGTLQISIIEYQNILKLFFKNCIIRVSVNCRYGAASSRRAAYCGHWMSNVTSNGARIHSPKRTSFSLDISSEVIKSVLSLKIDSEFTVVLENVWLTNKDNESLNSFQAELNYCRSS
jgi:hypothetical protein